ncbi:MAG: hypothetical protein IAF02_15720 [Anaerolineae bacterium]|nr:hypothetical protein [Anaerolineae bacterium]
MTIITLNSDLGGMEYPFLTQFDDWIIESSPLAEACDGSGVTTTLRWVKDDKVNDLFIPNHNTTDFLTATGLHLDIAHKGPFVLSKRISRIMRPFRFFEFCAPFELNLAWDHALNGRMWDGCALISRDYLRGFWSRYRENHPQLPQYQLDAHLSEIEHCQRWEITVVTPRGLEKAHALVSDSMQGLDFLFPGDSTKKEVKLEGEIFVGLHPVHGRDDMRLDVQSLINLFPFFEPPKLVAWASQEADLFLNRIKSGQLDVLLSRIENITSEEQLHELRNWYIGEYIASGGKLMWFPAAVKAMGRQFMRRLNHGQNNFRFPLPGGRYYIFPSSVGERNVPPGHIKIERKTGTAWVNQGDWNDHIVDILGGCDGDDALWIFPFTDFDNSRKILAWRSPNQLGEYILLEPTPDSDTIVWETSLGGTFYPRMDSRKLPPRIDKIPYTYDHLEPFAQDHPRAYTIDAMTPAIENAMQNGGMLGAYCNALMVITAVRGKLPLDLPARLEDVIDGSVKAPVDLSPVRAWIDLMMQDIVADSYDAVPVELENRILPALSEDDANALRIDGRHWLTSLMKMINHHVEIFQLHLDILAEQTEIPLVIFERGISWEEQGSDLAATYQYALRQGGIDAASFQTLKRLDGQHSESLLGAAAYIYNRGLSDSLLWLPDPKLPDGETGPRQPGTARLFLYALRQIGLIGDPTWTSAGTVLYYDEQPTGIPVQLNAVWFNWLKLQNAEWQNCTAMSQVPRTIRDIAKAQVEYDLPSFTGMTVNTRVADNDRVTVHDAAGNLLAFVKPGHETRLLKANTWRIAAASSKDGNLHTVITPL